MNRKGVGGLGTLPLLAIFLIASALVRLSGGPWMAMALNAAEKPHAEAAADAPAAPSVVVPEVLEALRRREEAVAMEEARLNSRMEEVAAAEAQMRETLAALEAAEARLAATIAAADGAAESDLAQLTAVYETMKPKEAAPLFEAMDPAFAAGFLGRMRPDAAARILAGLKPETAYAISVILASRNSGAPTN